MTKPRTGIYKQCLYCKHDYYIKPYLIPTSVYCSRSCKAKATLIRIKRNCDICHKEFEHISSRCNKAKYCSQKCAKLSLKGKGTTTYKCEHCHKEFKDFKRIGRKYCSKRCVGKSSQATWKGNFTTIRKNMLTRGLIKKCNRCGYDEYPKILGVHHKDRNRNNNNMENLEVLCPNCHSLEHMKHIVV